MAEPRKLVPFAPFRVRSYRFQWPSDLLTSWAFEMETIILGWYVLVESDSVIMLTLFGSLLFVGTLLSPTFGASGDRFGRRLMLCLMRASYIIVAAVIMVLGLVDELTPFRVLAIIFVGGLVRPSDISMRNSLIGDTIPID